MPVVRPFEAVTYDSSIDAELVTCPPYDVIDKEAHRHLTDKHPLNFVRLTLPKRLDDSSEDRYTGPASLWQTWKEDGTLRRSGGPELFLYRTTFQHRGRPTSTCGLVCGLELVPFGNGVMPHEATMPKPKADRLLNMRATGANLEPLWFVSSEPMKGFAEIALDLMNESPVAQARDEDGVVHTLWRVPTGLISDLSAVASEPALVIADGHHRYETALKYREEMWARSGAGNWDSTLALISDPNFEPPAVYPIHRMARGTSFAELEHSSELIDFRGSIEDLLARVDGSEQTIGVVTSSSLLTLRSSEDQLDVEFLQETLDKLAASVEFVYATPGLQESLQANEIAFVLKPVELETVIRRAREGKTMPSKATLFWPKPRSGLVMRDLT